MRDAPRQGDLDRGKGKRIYHSLGKRTTKSRNRQRWLRGLARPVLSSRGHLKSGKMMECLGCGQRDVVRMRQYLISRHSTTAMTEGGGGGSPG